ncbi:MAG: type II toxin-antitoxin system ParD family antitoxin [Alphaproteobacteria bacterium]
MPMTRKTITIPASMDDWVKQQIGTGRYSNDSEYFRDLIRHDQEKQEKLVALRVAIDMGRQSGASNSSMSDILREVQADISNEV